MPMSWVVTFFLFLQFAFGCTNLKLNRIIINVFQIILFYIYKDFQIFHRVKTGRVRNNNDSDWTDQIRRRHVKIQSSHSASYPIASPTATPTVSTGSWCARVRVITIIGDDDEEGIMNIYIYIIFDVII